MQALKMHTMWSTQVQSLTRALNTASTDRMHELVRFLLSKTLILLICHK